MECAQNAKYGSWHFCLIFMNNIQFEDYFMSFQNILIELTIWFLGITRF